MSASKVERRAAIAALASGKSQAEAAQVAGVDARTIRRWLKQKSFKASLAFLRDTAIREALTQLTNLAAKAVVRMAALLDGARSEAVQLKAAEAVLAHLLRLRESVDHGDQMADMQSQIDQLFNPTPPAPSREVSQRIPDDVR